MKDEYDFSNAIRNPFAEKIRKEGYTITIRYTPEHLAELRNKAETVEEASNISKTKIAL